MSLPPPQNVRAGSLHQATKTFLWQPPSPAIRSSWRTIRPLLHRERTRSGKWRRLRLRQSQIPQHIKYVLRGTLNVPRTMCNAEPAPQRRAQWTHDYAPVGYGRSGLMGQQRCAVTCRYQTLDRVVVVELNARRWMVSPGREPLRSQTRQTRGRVIENERLCSEPFRRDAGRAPPMRRHKGHHGVAAPRLYHESSHRGLRQCDQPNIQRSIRQSGQRFM